MYLKEMLALKAMIMKTLEGAVDEMLEQYQHNQLAFMAHNGREANPYLRPEKFNAKLYLDFAKGNQMGFSQLSCNPTFTIPDKSELMVDMK